MNGEGEDAPVMLVTGMVCLLERRVFGGAALMRRSPGRR